MGLYQTIRFDPLDVQGRMGVYQYLHINVLDIETVLFYGFIELW